MTSKLAEYVNSGAISCLQIRFHNKGHGSIVHLPA